MYKIMIIEDDAKLREQMSQILSSYGYQIVAVQDFHKVEERFQESKPDLIVLDINLPYYDGNYYCRIFRRHSKVPIVITSARNSDLSQIMSIELGADDYIVKPFPVELFTTKINAMIRRTYGDYAQDTLSIRNEVDYKLVAGGLRLDEKSFKIATNNMVIELSKNEFKLMKVFITKANEVLTREELLENLWDQSDFVDDNTLTVNITRLRSKLSELGYDDCIKTKRGVGYVFDI
ncbi:DNA-binding response regulator, OmpR family, contains REC and winged-helix (wHTH) domain [Anaerosporobacter mobilis DSM 15930]|uniref:Stage 0 sporulation protein A homolog n=1 Tax=Anaerosporobacter mobilis DSM 15930 TaxID=1120996 RepID=A0A1M7JUU4_9FIRM|nr:response regulator transcription factor [Anaerosporobacter mobilis]SHM56671.1 DNA-binding response regulator, OmpR family, contains REC and winged-helix (wHTH) domain [Anaerosporobacter mobilis DSM 15930]